MNLKTGKKQMQTWINMKRSNKKKDHKADKIWRCLFLTHMNWLIVSLNRSVVFVACCSI
jgi:hypothetical protein